MGIALETLSTRNVAASTSDIELISGALNLPSSIVSTWSTERLCEAAWEGLRIAEGKVEICQRERDALHQTWARLKRVRR